LRIHHASTAITSQPAVAPAITIAALNAGSIRHAISANMTSPMLPMAAPAASTEAACLARRMPFNPWRRFLSRSFFSISVALAGNIAGNARNKPPRAGPNSFAITPAAAVISPPKKNLTA